MNKEFYKILNKIEYSDNEINDYIEASGLTDEEIADISGAVRLKYGQKQIKYNAMKIKELLDEDENVERIIKFRDIESLEDITVSSFMGATTLKSNDFGVFKMICFTNKRLFFTDTNVLNEALTIGWINNEEIIGTKFTTKRVVFNRKDPSKIRFSRWTKGVIASEGLLLLNIISIFENRIMIGSLPFALLFFLAIKFQQKFLDRYVIIMKGKKVLFNDILFNLWHSMSYYDYTQGKLVNYIISVAKFTTIDYIR